MTLSEANALLLNRNQEISSLSFPKFLRKAKIHFDGDVIHVAGSNGKGETVFYLTRLALAKKHTGVGSFYNFYYQNFTESIWLDGKPLSEEKACQYLERLLPLANQYGITRFELCLAVALLAFQEAHMSLAILECGMGGEEDPTHIEELNQVGVVITNVALEHTEYLGTTLSEIALSISGIIAKGVPVIVGGMDESAEETLRLVAAKKKTWIRGVERVYLPHLVHREAFHFDYPPYKDIIVPGLASYHVTNACLALEAAKTIPDLQGLNEEQINASFQEGGILEGHLDHHGVVYFDGANNSQAVDVLRRCFATLGQKKDVHVLFACLRRQNLSAMLPLLDDAAGSVTLTTFDHADARDEMGYALYVEDHAYIGNPLMALMQLEAEHPGETIVATGCPEFVAYLKQRL